ncbi:class I SAM-dependent methyltransferase [Humitalea sp. 24SJ18S-53]|uniref:class I SAM-dependent methyltransferase n=1 Tax=Humitalea sp. 24SJ18S-53 TaxID=3422307 RepID=UPI003D676C53
MGERAVPANQDAFPALLAAELESCLWYPERLVWPNSWAGHIPFAFWLTQALRPRVLVELGVHTGNSYAAFCQAVKSLDTATACFGVDTWQGDAHAGLYDEKIYDELSTWHDAQYSNFSRLIRSTFDDAVQYIAPGSVDLLHIDGLHTYDAVRHDFETWQSRLSDRAVVLFHDTNVRDRGFGVWRFWEEMSAQYPSFGFLHGHGLGVLGVGTDLPPSVAALFDAERIPAQTRRVRDLFNRLGTPLMRDILLDAATVTAAQATAAERRATAAREEAERAAQAARQGAEQAVAAAQQDAAQAIAAAQQAAEQAALATRQDMERAGHAARERTEHAAALAVKQAQLAAADAGKALQSERDLLALSRQAAEAAAQEAARTREAHASTEAHLAAILGSNSWRSVARLQAMVADKPRLRRFLRRSAKAAWYMVTLQLFTRIRQRGQPAPIPAPVALAPAAPPLAAASAMDPVTLHVQRIAGTGRPPSPTDRPLVVFLSHVPPYPPRAGNEYRTERVLSWLRDKGWDVVFLYCPLGGEEPDAARLAALAAGCENLVYVHRDGQIRHSLARPDVAAVVAALEGRQTRDVAGLVQESTGGAVRLLNMMRTFSADALVEVMCAIDAALAPRIVIANYIFMTRGLKLLRDEALTIVDTIDVFSTKARKVEAYGIEDSLAMSEAEEAYLLSDADLVLAIQPEEADDLRRIAPKARVVVVGVDMPVEMSRATLVAAPVVLLVASGNPMNAKGLRDFLRFAWPLVLQAVPGAELRVVGSVGAAVPGQEAGVHRLGLVDDLGAAYAQARVVINPAVAGTGVKIKTLEAFANLRPLVTWPAGLDGVPADLRDLCECVTDWYAFAEALIRMLEDDNAARKVIANRDRIAELLSPAAIFSELDAELADRQVNSTRAMR